MLVMDEVDLTEGDTNPLSTTDYANMMLPTQLLTLLTEEDLKENMIINYINFISESNTYKIKPSGPLWDSTAMSSTMQLHSITSSNI